MPRSSREPNPSGEAVIRIATRGSELALWQADWVASALRDADSTLEVRTCVVHTTGDRVLDVPLARIGDRGLFTKEVDACLLNGEADLAVHSLKDVPTHLPEGLAVVAICEREDPRDVLLCRAGQESTLSALASGARVGTSSLRRRAQIRAVRPDLEVVDLRGNLNTRVARLGGGACEAIVLAAAGVLRLGWRARISSWLQPPGWLPAAGQGALAVVARADDRRTAALGARLNHRPTAACCAAERAFLRELEGGCQVPIGALASLDGATLRLDGLVSDLDGVRVLRGRWTGAPADAEAVGARLASDLLSRGADDLLAGVRASVGAAAPPAP